VQKFYTLQNHNFLVVEYNINFPEEVRKDIGSSLYEVQLGDKPNNAKPFKGVGSGVFEIVTRFDSDTYRTVYAVQIGNCIYVLHAFFKNPPKGLKQHKRILT
jgi:phage-related protein